LLGIPGQFAVEKSLVLEHGRKAKLILTVDLGALVPKLYGDAIRDALLAALVMLLFCSLFFLFYVQRISRSAKLLTEWVEAADVAEDVEEFADDRIEVREFKVYYHMLLKFFRDLKLQLAENRKKSRMVVEMAASLKQQNAQLKEHMELIENAQEQLVHAEKMKAVGQLTAGVAHEFNNLLGVAHGNLEILDLKISGSSVDGGTDLGDSIAAAKNAIQRGAELTRNMLGFAHQSSLQPIDLSLNEIVKSTASWAKQTLPANIAIELELCDDPPVAHLDQAMTENAVLNLMINARDAMPHGGTITLRTGTRTVLAEEDQLEPGEYVFLAVSDTGHGIDEETQKKIFEPFFTTKPKNQGSGLGLSLIHGFVAQSRGHVHFDSRVGKGTTFYLFFPRIDGRWKAYASKEEIDDIAALGSKHILLVDDNEDLVRTTKRSLEAVGQRVTVAHSGSEAAEILRQGNRFDVLISDMSMPGELDGMDLARFARQRFDDIGILIISGHLGSGSCADLVASVNAIHLSKPFTIEELTRSLSRLDQLPANQKKQ